MSEKTTNYTPGPWEWDSVDTPFQLAYGDVIGGDDSGSRYVCADDGTTIAILPPITIGKDQYEYQNDNARLIAAAPDLYEALDAVDKWGTNPDGPLAWEVLAQVKAALAKATGMEVPE